MKAYIWMEREEKQELDRIAHSNGLGVSQVGRAFIVDGIRKSLRMEREVLGVPILEAFFDRKMNQVINRLAEFLGRSVFETSQVRYLVINTLYRELVLDKVKAESDPKKKEQLTKDFYKLLDQSQKESVKTVKTWNPNIQDIVAAIKQYLKEGTEDHA